MSTKKKLEIQEIKERMISKMKQSQLKGGLVSAELIAGCCTQGCCGGDGLVEQPIKIA